MKDDEPSVVLCGIAKDEDLYLEEWISYHLSIGFDRIFIYDNESKRPIDDLLARKTYADKVTVIHWPRIDGQNSQDTAYADFLLKNRDHFDWVAILDVDELLNIKKHDNIKRFVKDFSDATSIAINWRIFGSSGLEFYSPEPMAQRFKRASEVHFHPNGVIKSMYRLKYMKAIFQHHGEFIEHVNVRSCSNRPLENHHFISTDAADFEVAQINHYFVRSKQEWAWKNSRGYTDHTVRPPEMFAQYDRNEIEDDTINRRFNQNIMYSS